MCKVAWSVRKIWVKRDKVWRPFQYEDCKLGSSYTAAWMQQEKMWLSMYWLSHNWMVKEYRNGQEKNTCAIMTSFHWEIIYDWWISRLVFSQASKKCVHSCISLHIYLDNLEKSLQGKTKTWFVIQKDRANQSNGPESVICNTCVEQSYLDAIPRPVL